MKNESIKKAIKFGFCFLVLSVVIIFVGINIMEYEQEGEKNMPFELSKIVIISTAEGIENKEENQDIKWKFNLIQNNDIYLSISKNKNYEKEDIIESVKIENIQYNNLPKIGMVKAYMPNSLDGKLYNYSDEYIITDNLEYRGSLSSNEKTLEIGNQGGNVLISFVNTGIGTYESNDDVEIKHDGSLIKKIERVEEDLKFDVSFDLVIKVKNKSYRTNISLNLPCGNILENGTCTTEITDTNKYIFKREKNVL